MKILLKLFLIVSFYFFSILSSEISAEEKLKIGLLIPMTGENEKIGQQIIKAVRLAINDIDYDKIEIIPKDTKSNPEITFKSANELRDAGVKIVIGPVFYKSLLFFYLSLIKQLIYQKM